jgi:molecular chaperone DnaJ
MRTNRPDEIVNPFEVLGIAPGSDHQTIKHAYRRLAKKFHPDVNPEDPEAEKHFKQIQWAYDTIQSGRTENNGNVGNPSKGWFTDISADAGLHPFFGFYEALRRYGMKKDEH